MAKAGLQNTSGLVLMVFGLNLFSAQKSIAPRNIKELYLKLLLQTNLFDLNDARDIIEKTRFPFDVQLAILVNYLTEKLSPRNAYLKMLSSYLLMITVAKRSVEMDHTADRETLKELVIKGNNALLSYYQTEYPEWEIFDKVDLLADFLEDELTRLELLSIPWGKF